MLNWDDPLATAPTPATAQGPARRRGSFPSARGVGNARNRGPAASGAVAQDWMLGSGPGQRGDPRPAPSFGRVMAWWPTSP
jgi:hypothetical protein